MPTTTSPLNGVDTDKLRTTIRTLEQHPELGVFRFGVARRWPDEVAGGGPSTVSNPTELLLHALAACLTDAVLQVAATQGVEIHDVDCRIEGSMDVRGTLGITTAVRNGFSAIRIALVVEGDADHEDLSAIVHAAKARSAVYDMVTNGVPTRLAVQS
jgi:uncharacterized OsmC-like protein